MNNNVISVIVPIYNSEDNLGRCLNSLVNQTYDNLEIILINDGSIDKSELICKSYQKDDNRIKYIYQNNSGVSCARNKGIDNATGKYIIFIDSDDYVSKNYLYNLYNKITKYNCKIAVSGLTEVTQAGEKLKEIKYLDEDKVMNLMMFLDDFINYAYFTCVKTLFEREMINNIRFISNLKYGEDILFAYSLFKSNRILYVSNVEYYYVQNSSSLTHQFDISNIEKYMSDTCFLLDQINNDYPEKKTIINNRILTKLNIAFSRYMNNKEFERCEIERIIKKYKTRIKDTKLNEINYLSFNEKIKIFFLKYNYINLYILVSKFKRVLKRIVKK